MIIGSDQTKDHKPKAQPNNQNTKIVLGKGEMKVWYIAPRLCESFADKNVCRQKNLKAKETWSYKSGGEEL